MNGFVPRSLAVKDRESLMDDLTAFLTGSSAKGGDLYEQTGGLESLEAAAFAGAQKDTATAQAAAVFAAALYRDARCAYATRGQIMGQGHQNQFVELHMGALIGKVLSV